MGLTLVLMLMLLVFVPSVKRIGSCSSFSKRIFVLGHVVFSFIIAGGGGDESGDDGNIVSVYLYFFALYCYYTITLTLTKRKTERKFEIFKSGIMFQKKISCLL